MCKQVNTQVRTFVQHTLKQKSLGGGVSVNQTNTSLTSGGTDEDQEVDRTHGQ